MQSTDKTPVRTIRLTSRQEQELLDRLDSASEQPDAGGNRRADPRLRFRPPAPVEVHIQQPNGSESRFTVLPRNLCAGGFGFVHGQFVHFPLKCIVILPTLSGQTHSVQGTVTSCRNISGLIHEVSIAFAQEIDPALFVPASDIKSPNGAEDVDANAPAPTGTAASVVSGKRVIVLGTASSARLAVGTLKNSQAKLIAAKDIPALLAALRAQAGQGLVAYELPPGQTA